MEFLLPNILEDAQSDKYLSPEQYTYWKARENRTFYIDYEIDEKEKAIRKTAELYAPFEKFLKEKAEE